MTSPFITVYTPTCRRPQALEVCKASVEAQKAHLDVGVQHLIVDDRVGVGMARMYADVANHHDEIRGDWVHFLSDDDVLQDEFVYRDFHNVVAAEPEKPDVVVCKWRMEGHLFPAPVFWGKKPICGPFTLGSWIVSRRTHVEIPYGARYEGDYDFLIACWKAKKKFLWWDRLIGRSQGLSNNGRAEA